MASFWLSKYAAVRGKIKHPTFPKDVDELVGFEPCESLKCLYWVHKVVYLAFNIVTITHPSDVRLNVFSQGASLTSPTPLPIES